MAAFSPIARDVAIGLGLPVALFFVFLLDKPQPRDSGNNNTDIPVEVTPGQAPPPKPLRLAVTPKHYDDMGSLLDRLGEGYRHTPILMEDLLDVGRLSQYDVVFLTCDAWPAEWGNLRGGSEFRAGLQQGEIK